MHGLFTTNKDTMTMSIPRPTTIMNGDTVVVKLVDVVETLLLMGKYFFPTSNNY